MHTISDRMKRLIDAWIPQRGRFKKLEEISEIPADHWKNFWHGKQRAHEYMIQSLTRAWPEYALWLVTGIYEEAIGQMCPIGVELDAKKRSIEAQILLRKIDIDERFNKTMRLSLINDSSMPETALEKTAENLAWELGIQFIANSEEERVTLMSKDENKLEAIFKSDKILNELKMRRTKENK